MACRMTTTGSPEHYLENDGKPLAELSGVTEDAAQSSSADSSERDNDVCADDRRSMEDEMCSS